ncbi:MAG: ATP-binding cassette domain-containing protein [Actinobacteria bacterium]|nr:MAG: ATP-binding cassette domain-containing protein [Actinomycetota bacterium]
MTDETAIVVESLTKKFGDVEALAGVDFQVESGTVFGLLGPNGAGKTTAIRILTTILPPDGGRAEVLGYDVVRDAQKVRLRIGMAGQFAAVDPLLTGRENLRLVGKVAQMPNDLILPRADELLERFELTDAANRPARTYSGGMRRRLDIAAALVARPPVLFLDEPTTGLDLHSRNELWAMIKELVAEGTTLLLTTQYLEEADRLAGRIAVIDGGRVIAEGTPSELKAKLGRSVIELSMADETDAFRAERALSHLGRPELDGTILRLPGNVPGGAMEVLRALDGAGLEPDTLMVREPSLDDVFLQLTGHKAERSELEDATVPVGGAR